NYTKEYAQFLSFVTTKMAELKENGLLLTRESYNRNKELIKAEYLLKNDKEQMLMGMREKVAFFLLRLEIYNELNSSFSSIYTREFEQYNALFTKIGKKRIS